MTFSCLLLSLLINISCSHHCYIWLTVTVEFRNRAASPPKIVSLWHFIKESKGVCVTCPQSRVGKYKKNKGGNVDMPRFGDTVLFSYCVMLFSVVCIVSAWVHTGHSPHVLCVLWTNTTTVSKPWYTEQTKGQSSHTQINYSETVKQFFFLFFSFLWTHMAFAH